MNSLLYPFGRNVRTVSRIWGQCFGLKPVSLPLRYDPALDSKSSLEQRGRSPNQGIDIKAQEL